MWSRDTRSSPGLKQSGTEEILVICILLSGLKMLTDGMGGGITYWTSSLHIWKVTISAETYIQVLEQHIQMMSFFKGFVCIFQQDNAEPYLTPLTTSWLHRRVRLLNCPAYSPEPLTYWEHLAHHKTRHKTKETQDCWAARILHHTKKQKQKTNKILS